MRRMKNFLTLSIVVFTVMFLSPSYAEGLICKITGWNCPLDFGDLVRREGLYYKKHTTNPYTGKSVGNEQGSLKNGGLIIEEYQTDNPYFSIVLE